MNSPLVDDGASSSLPTETRDQIISLEDRLERVELRRSALPAGMLLFAVLAYFMVRTEIRNSIGVRSGALWVLSFAVGAIALLVFNEVTARRTIRVLKEELKALRSESLVGRLGGYPG